MAFCFLSRASSVVATPFLLSKIAVIGLPAHQDSWPIRPLLWQVSFQREQTVENPP